MNGFTRFVRVIALACSVVVFTARATEGQSLGQVPHTPIETTGTGWTLEYSGGQVVGQVLQPKVVTMYSVLWTWQLGQSRWIGPQWDTIHTNSPGGDYTYTYKFCFHQARHGLLPVPATLHLQILAQDGFKAYLNSSPTPFLSNTAAYNNVTTGTVTTTNLATNVLRIVVHGNGLYTHIGLDVNGYLTAEPATCPGPLSRVKKPRTQGTENSPRSREEPPR